MDQHSQEVVLSSPRIENSICLWHQVALFAKNAVTIHQHKAQRRVGCRYEESIQKGTVGWLGRECALCYSSSMAKIQKLPNWTSFATSCAQKRHEFFQIGWKNSV